MEVELYKVKMIRCGTHQIKFTNIMATSEAQARKFVEDKVGARWGIIAAEKVVKGGSSGEENSTR